MLLPSGAGHKAAGAGAGGSIVLVSAALASHGLPNFEAMSAAKAGVEGETMQQSCWHLMMQNYFIHMALIWT